MHPVTPAAPERDRSASASGAYRATPEQTRSAAAAAGELAAVRQIAVDAESAGQRIDNLLLRYLRGVPRSHLYRLLRRGEVRVNKGRVKASYRVCEGDLVRIPPLRLADAQTPVQAPPARQAQLARAVLYEDARLLVIDKPSGLAVHGGSGLDYGLIESLRALREGDELELVHRLDRETSGCLLVSKRRSALRELHQLLREGGVEKTYLALLVGELPRPRLSVEAPLKKNVLRSGERLVEVDLAQGKAAKTLFRQVERYRFEELVLTLVEARPVTGRTHQIRVHAAHLGAALAGDPKYGDATISRRLKAVGLHRLFLHAASLAFRCAEMPQPLRVAAPLPTELRTLLDTLERVR